MACLTCHYQQFMGENGDITAIYWMVHMYLQDQIRSSRGQNLVQNS
jgi:hypothetical protein